eukprot:scaffold3808_cov112-Isochrysis_galbana.AAC.12
MRCDATLDAFSRRRSLSLLPSQELSARGESSDIAAFATVALGGEIRQELPSRIAEASSGLESGAGMPLAFVESGA